MTRSADVLYRWVFFVLLPASIAAGCGGGGGDGGGDGGGAQAATPPADVVVSGAVTFDLVPVVGGGLDYTGTVAAPARGVTVQAVSGDTVLATTTTDADGHYSLPVEGDTPDVRIQARAEMLRSGAPGWDFRVVDNTQENALYVLESAEFTTGAANEVRDLHAASGWDGVSYAATRAAAPFAILDVVHEAAALVAAAAPDVALPPLVLHWSPDNVPSRDDSNLVNFTTGEIGSSLFTGPLGIFLLGAEDSDTDEYDRHVIAHEWGHYLEYSLARSDSIGGPHTRGDQLDPRTAFSEGFGNAFSAMALGDVVYTDTLGPAQRQGFSFSIEGPFYPPHPVNGDSPNPNPGWFSEESVQELLYDLFDEAQDIDEDTLALGFAPILEVMEGPVRETAALTSIFPFVHALKAALPGDAPQIDALAGVHDIDPVADPFGSGEDNGGTPADGGGLLTEPPEDVIPIYKDIAADGSGAPVNVCSTDDFRSTTTGSFNKLGSRAFLRFTAPAAGRYTFTATTTQMPADQKADPDMWLHRAGRVAIPRSDDPEIDAEDESDPATCTVGGNPAGCAETFSRALEPGDYVLEVFEWTNTQNEDSENPPIGRTCFDVEITPP